MADFQDLLQEAEQMTAQIDKENTGLPRLQRTMSQLFEMNKRKLTKGAAGFAHAAHNNNSCDGSSPGQANQNFPSQHHSHYNQQNHQHHQQNHPHHNHQNQTGSSEVNASILLASRGIDAPKLSQTIDQLSSQSALAKSQSQQTLRDHQSQQQAGVSLEGSTASDTYERAATIEQLRDCDLQTFLRGEKESALMSIIEETRHKTMQDIDESFAATAQAEWDTQKQKIMQELLGTFTGSDGSNATTTTTSTATTTSSSSAKKSAGSGIRESGRTLMSDVEMEFAKEIYIYNEYTLALNQQQQQQQQNKNEGGQHHHLQQQQDRQPDLLVQLTQMVHQRLGDKNIEDAWNMLNFMTQKQSQKTSASASSSANSTSSEQFFVNQGVAYLEYCFRDLLQSHVNANLKQAKLGGALGTLALVQAYLRLPQSDKYHKLSDEFIEDPACQHQPQPVWATIYLCMRCGDVADALKYAVKAQKEDVSSYLDEMMRNENNEGSGGRHRRRLNPSTENKLRLEYKSRVKRTPDAYKKAVYCLLTHWHSDDETNSSAGGGGSGLAEAVMDNVDDFLWFKLSAIDPETYPYAAFQSRLSIEYGEKYFTSKQQRNPFTYLQVLLLTAQFEMAIEFLLKYETMIVHGVHMAIALQERGTTVGERPLLNLLHTSSSSQLIVAEAGSKTCARKINYPALIRMYTRKFECTDPREALQYYFLLHGMKQHQSQNTYFVQFIVELALETREFELLLGRLETRTATRRPGAVDKFTSEQEANTIIELVAADVESRGLVEEAIQLYDLSKRHQRVLELCNKLASQCVAHRHDEAEGSSSSRDRLKQMVTAIAYRYKTETNMSSRAIPKSIVTTFYLLTDLMTFFDLYHAESWELAYETLNKLAVLPQVTSGVDSKVRDFIAYSEEIKRNFPDIILAMMTIISHLYTRISNSSSSHHQSPFSNNSSSLGNNEKRSNLNQLKDHAKALIKFVGCIPYRLSGDVNARLLQLEVMMN